MFSNKRKRLLPKLQKIEKAKNPPKNDQKRIKNICLIYKAVT